MQLKPLIRKVRGRLRRQPVVPPEGERNSTELPEGGGEVSVEKALNSRCSSDYDDDQSFVHWGMFDRTKKLSDEQIGKVVSLAAIPRFTSHTCEIRAEKNVLSFIIDPRVTGPERRRLIIENGMRQQSAALLCAALGVGVCHRSFGPQGIRISDTDLCTIRLLIDPMQPSYGGSYWSVSAPRKERGWRQGNLPDPKRDGSVPLVSALADIQKTGSTPDRAVAREEVGQVLWAMKGRTPHFFKSFPWGMTVPTTTDERTVLFVCRGQGLFRYVNWEGGRPTHSIEKIVGPGVALHKKLCGDLGQRETFLLLKDNSPSIAAQWETGYCLMNALTQLRGLGVCAKASILGADNASVHTLDALGEVPVIIAL